MQKMFDVVTGRIGSFSFSHLDAPLKVYDSVNLILNLKCQKYARIICLEEVNKIEFNFFLLNHELNPLLHPIF